MNGIIGITSKRPFKYEFKLSFTLEIGYWIVCADDVQEAIGYAKDLQKEKSLKGVMDLSTYKTFWVLDRNQVLWRPLYTQYQ